jgi:hypothetical protein
LQHIAGEQVRASAGVKRNSREVNVSPGNRPKMVLPGMTVSSICSLPPVPAKVIAPLAEPPTMRSKVPPEMRAALVMPPE